MKDVRISIRLTEDEHFNLKLLAMKRKKSIQSLMYDYIKKELKKEDLQTNEKN